MQNTTYSTHNKMDTATSNFAGQPEIGKVRIQNTENILRLQ